MARASHPQASLPPPTGAFVRPMGQSKGRDPYVGRVVLGRYLVEEALERSPARAIYGGTDIVRDCPVLVQQVRGHAPALHEEAPAALVRGLGVAPLVGFGATSSSWTAVFEARGRESLVQLLRAGRVPLETCLSVAVDVASGLATAHARGLAHGRLRAEEIWLHRGPSRTSAQVAGFGMLGALDEEWETSSGVFARRSSVGAHPRPAHPSSAHPSSADPSAAGADLVQFGHLLTGLVQRTITTTLEPSDGRRETWWGCETLYGIADRCLGPEAPNARTVRRALRWIETRHLRLVAERGSQPGPLVVLGAVAPPRRQRETQRLAKVIVEPNPPARTKAPS